MTTLTEREEVTTSWSPRTKPTIYIAPLEWVNDVIVHDEDDEVIYIISNEWKLIPATFWNPRPVLDD